MKAIASISILYACTLLPVYAIPVPDETSIASTPPALTSVSPSNSVTDNSSASASNLSVVSNSSLASTFPTGTQRIAVNEGSGNLAAYSSSGALLGHVQASAAIGKNATSPDTAQVGSGALAGSAVAAATTTTTTVKTCRPATSDEITTSESTFNQSVPGLQALTDAATKYGGGQKPTRIYVNDPSYPNVVATICYSTDTVNLAPSGSPSCSSEMTNLNADQTNTGQPITLTHSVLTGFKSDVSTTTTKTSQFNWSDTITAQASIPEIMDVSSVNTFSLQISNTQGTSTTTSIDSQTSDKVTYTSRPGVNCPVQANVTTCNYEATGSIDVYLSGSIWFEYKTWFREPGCLQALIQPGAPCAGKGDHPKNDLNHCYDNNKCPTHGHWNWDISNDLPNISDRSNPIQFKNGFKSTDTANYKSDCDSK
ncbi:hypothetical protein DFH09DRAFT_1320003 [Mycena vulgaris]|nr:hypothetical protein DFH09DRAFT_1320003 [Mycena vulgaris]